MVSNSDEKCTEEILEETGPNMAPNGHDGKEQIALYVQSSQRVLLNERRHKNFLDIVKYLVCVLLYKKFVASPSARFRQITLERDEVSCSVPSADLSSPAHFHVPFIRDINWASGWVLCKEWIRNPMNMALFVWLVAVTVSGAILFLVMKGILNGALPRKSQRDTWFEVNNQILNALFTLICLYQHPKRFYHLVLLCRWRPEDILKLRKIYCKNGTYKPNEWMHMMVVVILLHLSYFSQYALSGLNLGYSRSQRPAIGVGLCIFVSTCASAFASVYNIRSPLGREYETVDLEEQDAIASAGANKSLQKKFSFGIREGRRVAETKPEWVGGLFDFWDDISAAYLSVFCSCCVFGWNMDRLGFGNMYVHVATFLLFCSAPFFIFNLAAVNINNEAVRGALGITGIFLCVFGLLYGGLWRIQMRKRFKLPENTFCCCNPSVTDCFQWLCCCSCSLAQEVRTADYYTVVEDKFCTKQTSDDPELMLSPLPREDRLGPLTSNPRPPCSGKARPSVFKEGSSSTPTRSSGRYTPDWKLPTLEESSVEVIDNTMKPPVSSMLQR